MLSFPPPPLEVYAPFILDFLCSLPLLTQSYILLISSGPFFSLFPVAAKPLITGFPACCIELARFAHAFLFPGDLPDQFFFPLLLIFGVPWHGFIMPYFSQKWFRCPGTSVTYVLILFCNLWLGTVPRLPILVASDAERSGNEREALCLARWCQEIHDKPPGVHYAALQVSAPLVSDKASWLHHSA